MTEGHILFPHKVTNYPRAWQHFVTTRNFTFCTLMQFWAVICFRDGIRSLYLTDTPLKKIFLQRKYNWVSSAWQQFENKRKPWICNSFQRNCKSSCVRDYRTERNGTLPPRQYGPSWVADRTESEIHTEATDFYFKGNEMNHTQCS
jgi:hypothetical protein